MSSSSRQHHRAQMFRRHEANVRLLALQSGCVPSLYLPSGVSFSRHPTFFQSVLSQYTCNQTALPLFCLYNSHARACWASLSRDVSCKHTYSGCQQGYTGQFTSSYFIQQGSMHATGGNTAQHSTAGCGSSLSVHCRTRAQGRSGRCQRALTPAPAGTAAAAQPPLQRTQTPACPCIQLAPAAAGVGGGLMSSSIRGVRVGRRDTRGRGAGERAEEPGLCGPV